MITILTSNKYVKMVFVLYLVPNPDRKDLYVSAAAAYNSRLYVERDAGFDLYCCGDTLGESALGQKLDLGCVAACYDTRLELFRAYWLLPRSSLSKTPIRMSNSVGLIDAGYRGTLMAAVDNRSTARVPVDMGTRLFQITTPDMLPWDTVHIVDEIPGGATLRGRGGFGSTGVSYFT